MRSAELMSGDYIHPLKLLSSAACRYMANNFFDTTPRPPDKSAWTFLFAWSQRSYCHCRLCRHCCCCWYCLLMMAMLELCTTFWWLHLAIHRRQNRVVCRSCFIRIIGTRMWEYNRSSTTNQTKPNPEIKRNAKRLTEIGHKTDSQSVAERQLVGGSSNGCCYSYHHIQPLPSIFTLLITEHN